MIDFSKTRAPSIPQCSMRVVPSHWHAASLSPALAVRILSCAWMWWGDMSKYICCQGMFGGCCCIRPGNMGEQDCPMCCLCLEATCCLSLAISASRWYIMEQRGLHSDPCDRRIIRVNNCLQCLACICTCLAICIEELRGVADLVQHIAHIFFSVHSSLYVCPGPPRAQGSSDRKMGRAATHDPDDDVSGDFFFL